MIIPPGHIRELGDGAVIHNGIAPVQVQNKSIRHGNRVRVASLFGHIGIEKEIHHLVEWLALPERQLPVVNENRHYLAAKRLHNVSV